MHSAKQKEFLFQSELKTNDFEQKRKIDNSTAAYKKSLNNSRKQFIQQDKARKIAKNKKWKSIENLDTNLTQFEKQFTQNGGKLIWAETIEQAQNAILEICLRHKAKNIVKSKSMVTQEIGLNQFLSQHNISSIETDLGEYIQQLDNEPPYHIVTPAMHKSKEDVARLFYNKLNTEAKLTPEELTLVARKKMRQKFTSADIGITGANFLLADVGGVCITENEGNARMSASFPPVHIVITGIEKVLTSIKDLELFWPLTSTYGTGQQLTTYNSVFTGPRQINEIDGPEHMYVILIDNGRTSLVDDPELRESLYCIRCGACLNVCPVFQNIGGHTYGTTYNGPIGSVITPHLERYEEYNHLSHASTLCGQCSAVCPVNINIHGMLHYNRTLGQKNKEDKRTWRYWRFGMKNKRIINLLNKSIKHKIVRKLFGKQWSSKREDLKFGKTFRELYKQNNK